MNSVEAVIFDCDGVMFASVNANLAYYDRILEHFSCPRVDRSDAKLVHFCHTASSPEVLAALLAPEDLEAALAYASGLDYRDFIPFMAPEDHLVEALQILSRTFPLAIATNRGRSIIPILEHFALNEYFSVVVNSHDVVRPKPAPDMLFLAAQRLNRLTTSCLFIGDSERDQQAAEAAGIPFIGYGVQVDCERTIASHQELLDCLLNR